MAPLQHIHRVMHLHTIWPRKDGAPPLPRPPPNGHRPPNGLIWGHSYDEFAWIKRYTDIEGVVTMWSRSMLQEHGEVYTNELEEMFFDTPEIVAKPRRRKPWPVLRVKGKGGLKKGMRMDPPLGEVDEGSDHELAPPRDAFLVDSDDEIEDSDEEFVDSPDNLGSVPHDGSFSIPMNGIREHGDRKHWRRYVAKKRTYGKTGNSRFFVKPPANLYSMTLEDLDKYDEAKRIAAELDKADDADSIAVSSSEPAHAAPAPVDAVTVQESLTSDVDMADEEAVLAQILIDGMPDSTPVGVLPTNPSVDNVNTPMNIDSANAPAIESKAVAVKEDVDMVFAAVDTPRDVEDISVTSEPRQPAALPGIDNFTFVPKPPQSRPLPNPFSRSGIPTLQENIPRECFPDTLIVHDPSNASMACDDRDYRYGSGEPNTPNVTDDVGGKTLSDEGQGRTAFVYKRIYPVPANAAAKDEAKKEESATSTSAPSATEEAKTAHLYLRSSHRVGVGHHSHVYRSPLTLPSPLTTYASSSSRPGTVLVAAKLAIQQRNARKLLDVEAGTYNEFPTHLSEEYCGVHLLSPFMRTMVPSSAIVPKFFGYYVPVYEKGDQRNEKGKLRYPWQKRSPILLMEDCGKPISAAELDRFERIDCYGLIIRLHMDHYLHGSFHERNIVVQPGPLTQPPMMRSMDTPSFRVIDFGRTITWDQWLEIERESDLAKFKQEDEEKRKSISGKGKEKEMYEKNTQAWWANRKRDMTEEETRFMDLDSNPYWRAFEGKMAMEWRDARKELLFDPVESI
ncbi:hypothetical protein EIP91_006819 [Steccherinum ochraceum]|uniref:Protein kinase domain-containing protein n=1 Tax=Steccherinum ochraceum TaxID=92696 RepID=A0A4R0R533_9APHY|nr:hypothetical protein EIP91_006819 [Steccherinum ochraceum]